ncbi:MAG: alpha-galactosidase [Clostridia bacterium]|nr:alpha-galactosidase [Clostridia bacterium]
MKYTYRDYLFGKTLLRYVISDETGRVFLNVLPQDAKKAPNETFETVRISGDFDDNYDWYEGALFHLQLSHHARSPYANSQKLGASYTDMRFRNQTVTRTEDKTVIETLVASDEGYEVCHTLTNYKGDDGFLVYCTFKNNTGKALTLEMFEGASLDNLSPYMDDDGSKDLSVHVFKSGWGTEGVHFEYTLPELNIGKGWGGNYKNHKIGTQGSRPTADYFPIMAVEDKKAGVIWGMELYCEGTWQIELSRIGWKLSMSGGLGDCDYGNWTKTVQDGDSFKTPKTLIASVSGGISDLCDIFLKMRDKDIVSYGKSSMPVIFNEWCTSWGKPSHEKNLELAKKLNKSKLRYFVMDAGWYSGAIGDWEVKKEIFPNGLRAYTDDIKKLGFVPGIWMELECTNEGSKYFSPQYDNMHLTHNGDVIVGSVGLARRESFWNFTNPETVGLLEKKIINFLKENGFGYLKIDYNANIGTSCDGYESGGEGLRQQMLAVHSFIKKIRTEIPDIVIENCSSGGMRLEPNMMSLTDMSSFSDAHVSVDIPIIAANLQYIIPPCQSQIWCTLRSGFGKDRFSYTVASGFLGRICWSGDIMSLNDEQMEAVYKAEDFYEQVSHIIRHGKSIVFRTQKLINFRYPEGTQAVIRYSDTGDMALVVYHSFKNPQKLKIPLSGKWEAEKTLYDADIKITDEILIDEKKEFFGNVVLLRKTGD